MQMKPRQIHCQNCGALIKPEDYKCPDCGAINHWKQKNAGKYKLQRSRLNPQEYQQNELKKQQNEQKKRQDEQMNKRIKEERHNNRIDAMSQIGKGMMGCGASIMILPFVIIFGGIVLIGIYELIK